MPPRIALGHALTGRPMTAAQALAHGLVNEVVPAAGLAHATQAWVDDVLAAAPLAVRATREAVWRSLDVPLPTAFTQDYPEERRRWPSVDAIEGPRAFAEGRPPRWRAV